MPDSKLKIGSVPCKVWLTGGYMITFHVDPENFEDAAYDLGGRVQSGQDIPLGNRAEHDISLWSITENGDILMCRLPETVSIPNNKILLYQLG